MVRWLIGLALLLVCLPALAHSPHSYDRSGSHIEVVATGPKDLKLTVDGAEWTYSTHGPTSSLRGPTSAPSREVQFVSSIVDQYWADHPESTRGGSGLSPLVGLLIVGLGMVGLAKPEIIWWLKSGWAFRDAEPSDLALSLHRISGGIAVLVGIGLFISGL